MGTVCCGSCRSTEQLDLVGPEWGWTEGGHAICPGCLEGPWWLSCEDCGDAMPSVFRLDALAYQGVRQLRFVCDKCQEETAISESRRPA